MRLTAGLDSGPVYLARREPITPEDTYGSLEPRLQELGRQLLLEVLDGRAAQTAPEPVEQDEQGVTYAEKIGAEDRLLDPSRTAVELERTVRALHPHIGARVALADGTLLGVHRAALVTGSMPGGGPGDSGTRGPLAAKPGLTARGQQLLLVCREGALELLRVQPPGGREMDAAAYLRGHGLPARA